MATSLSSAIHSIQLILFEAPSTPISHLLAAAALFSQADYADVVTERSIAGLCGYPCCPNPLASRSSPARYRVSLREHRVFDLEETHKFCSYECHVSSAAFGEGLSEGRRSDVDVGRRKIKEVMKVFGEGGEDGDGKGGKGVGDDLVIREREVVAEVSANEWIGPANAIEGYVPLANRGYESLSNFESVESIDHGSSAACFTSSIITGDEMNGDVTKNSSTMAGDVSDSISKKLNNMVITQTKTTADKALRNSSSSKHQTVATKKASDRLHPSYMDFTSSIIFDNKIGPPSSSTTTSTTEDVSDSITNQMENVSIAEKKATPAKTLCKTRPKIKKKSSNKRISNITPEGNISTAANVNAVTSTNASPLDCSEHTIEESNYDISFGTLTEQKDCLQFNDVSYSISKMSREFEATQLDNRVGTIREADSEATTLKSSLKTSKSKVKKDHSVKWADKKNNEVLEDKMDTPSILEEDYESSLRLSSAEACVAALTQAANAVASGEMDEGDAVSEAGIVILPEVQSEIIIDPEADEDAYEFDRGVLKWPQKTVLLDTDMFDVEDSWHDTVPEGFSLALSTFATMWMALFEWITCSSVAYIYGHDESSQEDFLSVNGREYPRKVYIIDGKSDEIKLALSGFIVRALPTVAIDLRLSTPVSTLEKFLGRYLDTMSFVDALPSFRMKQWQVIVILFIEALSVHRLPSITPHISSRNGLINKVLTAAHVSNEEYELMRDLIMPLGRVPNISMQRGG